MVFETILYFPTLHCASCLNRIDRLLRSFHIDRFHFDFSTRQARFMWSPEEDPWQLMHQRFEASGYPFHVISHQQVEMLID